jgi:hypothetical protein
VRSIEKSIDIFHLNVKLETPAPLKHTAKTLEDKPSHEPIFINECLPIDKGKRYDALQLLKEQGLPFKTVMYTHSPGGSIPNSHFVWKINSDETMDEINTTTTVIVAKISSDLPKYHTRQMRREFKEMTDLLTTIRPSHYRAMYQLLTGDASAPCNETEKEIDSRVQQLLELHDPDIVTDLRKHNPGRPSIYEPFWMQVINGVKMY